MRRFANAEMKFMAWESLCGRGYVGSATEAPINLMILNQPAHTDGPSMHQPLRSQ
jgi:hypothetical protein